MTEISLLVVVVCIACVFFAGLLGYQRGFSS